MKGVRGCEYLSKFNQPLHGFQSMLFENPGIHFILHYTS
jgi:hypothetical protein